MLIQNTNCIIYCINSTDFLNQVNVSCLLISPKIQLPASAAAGLSPSDSSDFTSDDEVKKSDSCDSIPETEEKQSSSWSSRRAEGKTANPNEPHSKDTSAHSSSSRPAGGTAGSFADPVATDDSSNSGKDATKPEEP